MQIRLGVCTIRLLLPLSDELSVFNELPRSPDCETGRTFQFYRSRAWLTCISNRFQSSSKIVYCRIADISFVCAEDISGDCDEHASYLQFAQLWSNTIRNHYPQWPKDPAHVVPYRLSTAANQPPQQPVRPCIQPDSSLDSYDNYALSRPLPSLPQIIRQHAQHQHNHPLIQPQHHRRLLAEHLETQRRKRQGRDEQLLQ